MIFVFIGPPGSGKSTQSQILSKDLGIPTFSFGKLLKEAAAKDPVLDGYVHRGDLVPRNYVEPILQKIKDAHDSHGILDGFPRTPDQTESLIACWDPSHIVAFRLSVPDEVVFERLSHRLEGGQHRYDDTPEIIKHRLEVHYHNERQVLQNLKEAGVRIVDLNGDQIPEKIHEQIMALAHTYEHPTQD